MTDKEIARLLRNTRCWVEEIKTNKSPYITYNYAARMVFNIHHIINSINWED